VTIPSPDPTPFHPPIRVEFKAPPERPNGGATVYVAPPVVPVEWFLRMPNGGTVNARPVGSGNPYANVEEQEVPVVVVELPEMEDDSEGS